MRRRLFIFGALIAVSILFSLLAVQSRPFSRLLSRLVQVQLAKALDGEVEVGGIDLYPLQRKLVVHELALRKKRSDLRRLAFAELSLKLAYSPLALGKIAIAELKLVRPEVFWAESALAGEKKTAAAPGSRLRRFWERRSFFDIDIRQVQIDQLRAFFHYPSAGLRGDLQFESIETRREGEAFHSLLHGRGRLHFRTGLEELKGLSAEAVFSKEKGALKKLELLGQGLRLVISGAVFPRLDLAFSFSAEPSAFARLSRGQVAVAERLTISGKLGGSVSSSQAQGRLEKLNLKLAGLSFSNLAFDYRLGRQQVQLSNGSFLGPGGPVRFNFSLRKKKKLLFDFDLENEIPDLARLLPQMGIETGRLFPRGNLHCRVSAEGQAQPVEARLQLACQGRDLGVAVRSLSGAEVIGHYPLGGEELKCALRYHQQRGLSMDDCRLEGGKANARLSGKMPRRGEAEGRLDLRLTGLQPTTGRLPAFAAFLADGAFALERGKSRWRGEVRGADFRWQELQAPQLTARAQVEEGMLHLQQLSLLFRQGTATASGAVPLTEKGHYALQTEIRDLALPPFMSLWPEAQKTLALQEGFFHFQGEVRGPAAAPHFSGALQLSRLDSALSGFEQGQGRLEWDKSMVAVKNGELSGKAGRLQLAGSWSADGSRSLFLHGEGLNLDRLTVRHLPPYLRGQLTIDSRLERTAKGEPRLEGNLRLVEREASGERELLQAAFNPQAGGGALDLSLLGGKARGRFAVQLRSPYRLDGELTLQRFDPFALLIRRPRDRVYARGELSGVVRLQVPLADPAQAQVSGRLHEIVVRGERYALYSPAALDFELAPGKLTFNPLRLVGERGDLLIRPERDGAGKTRLVASGEMDLIYLSYLLQDIPRAEGRIPLSLAIEDPLGPEARIDGQAWVENGLVAVRGFPALFQKVNARVELHNYRLLFEEVRAEAGGGPVKGKGIFVFGPERWLTYDLEAEFQSMRLAVLPTLPLTASGKAYFRGTEPALELGGEAKIEKAIYSERFDWRSSMGSLFQRKKESQLAAESAQENQIKLHLRLDGTKGDIRVRNSFMNGEVRGELALLGTTDEPVLNGALTVQGGEAYFQNNRFEIQSSSLQLIGEKETRAIYTVAAQSQIKDYTIFLNINGVNDEVRVNLTSDPALTPTEIVALLTLGIPSAEAGQVANAVSDAGRSLAISVVTGELQSLVESGSRRFGLIDTFQIVPSYSEDTRTTGLRMVVGKELVPRVDLQYSTDLDNIGAAQEIRLRNRINRNFSILGSFKDNSETANKEYDVGLDLEVGFEF